MGHRYQSPGARVCASGLFILLIAVFHSDMMLAQTQGEARLAGAGEVATVGTTGTSDGAAVAVPAAPAAPTVVRILAGRSALVDIGSPITRVSLTSADVADALVTSSSQLLVHGKVPGTISMFVWDRAGDVQRYEIAVQRDVAHVADQMRSLFPHETIAVESNGRNIVLAGTASSKEVADRAIDVAAGFVDKREEVVSLLQIQAAVPSRQVLLHVRFAEVSRSAMTQFGLSLLTSPTGVSNTIGRVTTEQFPAPGFDSLTSSQSSSAFGAPVTSASGQFTFSDFLNLFLFSEKYDLGLMVKALQTRGLFQSLAEPNLVAESGKEASFLAGGEFPIPSSQGFRHEHRHLGGLQGIRHPSDVHADGARRRPREPEGASRGQLARLQQRGGAQRLPHSRVVDAPDGNGALNCAAGRHSPSPDS